jgi:hypothetical protein
MEAYGRLVGPPVFKTGERPLTVSGGFDSRPPPPCKGNPAQAPLWSGLAAVVQVRSLDKLEEPGDGIDL